MPKATRRSLSATLLPVSLERGAAISLQRQLFEQLRELILGGRVKPGARLPSTRALAEELSCSRNTVIGAYDQLFAEGYLEGESGSGTYVSRVLPEELLRAKPGRDVPSSHKTLNELYPRPSPGHVTGHPRPALSRRGTSLAAVRRDHLRQNAAFSPGMPETAHFPWETWNRLLARTWRRPDKSLVRHGEAGGYAPLRQAIAKYVAAVRGVNCDWHQVIITAGGQQCIDLTVKALTDPGDRVWVEEPGYTGLRGPLLAAGVEVVPVSTDPEGLDLEAALKRASDARLAIVTPSHQYPLGIVMSLARRLQLLEWARETGSYILEDDYDSEYRYGGRPLSALQGLDRSGRVIYAGSFSKVLFPSLRLGYLVVPEGLANGMIALRRAIDDHPASLAQPVLAEFFEEGHFAAHLRRSRRLYAERQKVLLEAAAQKLGGILRLRPDEAGLHLVADLAEDLRARMTDRQAAKQAAEVGITTPPLSDFYLGHADRQGLLLGYAAVPEAVIREKVGELAAALSRGGGL